MSSLNLEDCYSPQSIIDDLEEISAPESYMSEADKNRIRCKKYYHRKKNDNSK